MNHITLIGRLTRDPELVYTKSQIAYINFCIAVDRDYKNADGERDTDFLNCTAWRKAAEVIAEYVKKGNLFAVRGSLQIQKWETESGEKRSSPVVNVDQFQFLERRDRSESPAPTDADAPPAPKETSDDAGDDLPF